MSHRFASVLAVLSLCLGVYAQKPDTKPTDMAAGKPDYSPESFVLEQVRTRYRFEMMEPAAARFTRALKFRVKRVFSSGGRSLLDITPPMKKLKSPTFESIRPMAV